MSSWNFVWQPPPSVYKSVLVNLLWAVCRREKGCRNASPLAIFILCIVTKLLCKSLIPTLNIINWKCQSINAHKCTKVWTCHITHGVSEWVKGLYCKCSPPYMSGNATICSCSCPAVLKTCANLRSKHAIQLSRFSNLWLSYFGTFLQASKDL